ncbi:hypothetical protein KR059_002997 [Drosophila kikkawai]|nr:hypothetical protein KR059_002997 [Drosophila kikkawai]
MPKETSNQQPVSAKKCMCKPTLSEILANEISSQPHVLLLKKRLNKSPAEQQGSGHVLVVKKQMDGQKKSPAEQQSSEPQEKCSCDYQEDDCSSSDTEEPKNSPCTEKPVNCPCKEEANYCKNGAGVDAAISAGCTNRCGWMTCSNPWPCCCGRFNGPCNSSFIGPCKSSFIGPCNSTFLGPCNGPCNGPWNRPRSGPCNGCLCYYGNCCSGCGNCCNYRCNPCGGCFCQPSAGPAKTGKDSGKCKEKQEGKRTFHSRRLGGTAGNNPSYSSLRPTSTFGNFIPAHPTMQGYFPTAPPQYISPYSGHWQAGEVLLNPMFSNQHTLDS